MAKKGSPTAGFRRADGASYSGKFMRRRCSCLLHELPWRILPHRARWPLAPGKGVCVLQAGAWGLGAYYVLLRGSSKCTSKRILPASGQVSELEHVRHFLL